MQEGVQRAELFARFIAERGFSNPAAIIDSVEWVTIERGEVLFRQGDPGDSLYLVMRGRVSIMVATPDSPQGVEIATYTRGDIFGEFALLAEQPRAATVKALRATELARISREAAARLFSETEFLLPLVRLVAARAARNEGKSRRPRVVGLFRADEDPAVEDASRRLASAIAEQGSVSVIHRDDIPDQFRRSGKVDWIGVHDWLSDCEQDCRFLVLIGAPGDDYWNREVAARVDTALWLVDRRTRVERLTGLRRSLRLEDFAASVDEAVVASHPGNGVDRELARRWRKLLPDARLHHAFDWSGADLERVARRVCGNANAVVLSGGGARAFAHIGMLRALKEAGIPVDIVGGTSVGSVIACQYASGWSDDDMLERNRHYWRRLARQFTLPIVSVWSEQLLNRMLEDFFGDSRIEDLALETFVCATNLDSCEAQYKREGLVRSWCRASMSLPAMWPPFCDSDGTLYVDGGVLDNLPVAGVEGEVGRLIACNVSRTTGARVSAPDRVPPDGVAALKMSMRGALEAPVLAAIIYRTAVAGSLDQFRSAQAQADVFIEPELESFGIADYPRIDDIAMAGYVGTMSALDSPG